MVILHEYMPIVLILLFLLEYNGAHPVIIHIIGIAFMVGRYTHAKGILNDNLRQRITGMGFTLNILIGLSLANIVMAFLKLLRTYL